MNKETTIPRTITTPDGDTFQYVPVSELRLSDLVDLESCPHNKGTNFAECELGVVAHVEVETPDCVCIGFDGIDWFGYPPTTELLVLLPRPEED